MISISTRLGLESSNMKIMNKWAIVFPVSLLGSVALFVEYGHVRKHQENKNLVHVAATELRSSLVVGVNYSEFGEKLTHLYSAVTLATESGISKRDLAPYHEALELYKEGYDLWTYKVQNPKAFDTYDHEGRISGVLRELIVRYKVPVKPLFMRSAASDECTFCVASKALHEAAEKEDKEDGRGLLHGWFDLPVACDAILQEIWSRAAAKLDAATH
jgi:hypothetical protein